MKKINKWWYIAGGALVVTLLFKNKAVIMDTWDKYTNDRLSKLHPLIQGKVTKVINTLSKKGIDLRITVDGHYRTFAEQASLYAQGRTAPGPILTNAQAGSSWHNYGLAVDVVEIKDGKALFTNPNWKTIADEFKKEGFEWGGDFTSMKDYPHFQYRNGLTIAQAKTKYEQNNKDTAGYILLA